MSTPTTAEEREAFRQHVDEWGEIPADDIVRLIDQVDHMEETILQVIGESGKLYLSEVRGVIRCQITNNPCGTDTWMVGHPCTCEHCTAYLTLHKLVHPEKEKTDGQDLVRLE